MPLEFDKDRIIGVLTTLIRRAAPSLPAELRAEAESAVGLLPRFVLGQAVRSGQVQADADLARRTKEALADEGEWTVPRRQDLREILLESQRLFREADARGRTATQAAGAGGAIGFPFPAEEELTLCLRRQFPDDASIRAANVAAMTGGNGKQTILLDAVSDHRATLSLVMRRDIQDSFNETTVDDEFPLLEALSRLGVTVPTPLWTDGSRTILSTAYMVTQKVAGALAGDGLGPRQERGFAPANVMARALAALHDVNVADIPAWSARRWDKAAALADLARWEDYLDRKGGIFVAAAKIAFEWLRRNVHLALQDRAVVHGEMGFHNLMIEDGRLTAILDWEMAHVGSAAEDLGYVRGQIEQQGSFDEFLDLYVRYGGVRPDRAVLHYWDIYRLARNIGLFAAAIRSFNQGGTDRFPLLHGSAILFTAYVKELDRKMLSLVEDDASLAAG